MRYLIFAVILLLGYLYFPWSGGGDEKWLKNRCAQEEQYARTNDFNGNFRCNRVLPGPGMKMTFIVTTTKMDAAEFPPGFESQAKIMFNSNANFQARLKEIKKKKTAVVFAINSRDQRRMATLEL